MSKDKLIEALELCVIAEDGITLSAAQTRLLLAYFTGAEPVSKDREHTSHDNTTRIYK